MALVKLALMSVMLAQYSPESEETWGQVIEDEGEDWLERVDASLKAKGAEDAPVDPSGRALILILKSVKSRSKAVA